MSCPGYKRKSWWSSKCIWFKKGSWGWVGSSSFCDHPKRTIEVCLTGGNEPKGEK